MAEYQTPINKYFHCGKMRYTYKCNGCGKEVSGYNLCKVRGRVLCGACRSKDALERNRKLKIKESQSDYIRGCRDERLRIMNAINGLDRQFGILIESVLNSEDMKK